LHHHSQLRQRHPKDIGRRVHELVYGERPFHGSNLPLSVSHLRALLELLEAEGHDVVELREELAQLLRALLRARHVAIKLNATGAR